MTHFVFKIFLLSTYLTSVVSRTYVKVDANEEVCFFEELKTGEPLFMTFEVVEGGYLDIDARILSPSNQELYSVEKQTEGETFMKASQEGRYTICFGNKMSTLTSKLVNFGIHPRRGELLSHEMEAIKEEHLAPVQDQVLRLSDIVLKLSERERHLRSRSKRHQQTADSTHSRSFITSIFEAIIMVAMNLWQIYYLRRFFEVKRVL